MKMSNKHTVKESVKADHPFYLVGEKETKMDTKKVLKVVGVFALGVVTGGTSVWFWKK